MQQIGIERAQAAHRLRYVVFVREHNFHVILAHQRRIGHLGKAAAQDAHRTQRRKGQRFNAHLALFAQLHQQRSLLRTGFRKIVAQRCAAVAHAAAAKALRLVNMPQSDVVKRIKRLCADVVKAADAHFL